MADSEPLMRVLGGHIGTAVVLTSWICIIAASVSISLAEAQTDEANIYMITNIAHDDVRSIFGYLCFSSIALFIAMMVEHLYILLVVGPSAFFTRHIPPSIMGRRIFYITPTCYWVSFAGGEASLIRAMISVRQGVVPNSVTYAYASMFMFLLFTMLLHVTSNKIRWCLLVIAWIDGFSSIVQSEDFEDCVICLETPAVGESIRSLPCEHKFHQMCVDEWLLRNPSCPLCRWSSFSS